MAEREASGGLPGRILATLLLVRTVTNLNIRILYPFLPAVARGMDVSLAEAGRLLAVQGGMGLTAPLFGPLSDRIGRRLVMEIGLALLALGALVVALTGAYIPALFAFAGMGLSKGIYDPAMLAYVGDLIPYERRGRAIALTEFAWALAWLIGVPATGFLIDRAGWTSPWWLITGLALGAILLTRRVLPPAGERSAITQRAAGARTLLATPGVLPALMTSFGMMFAVENVFVIYGAFLEDSFALSLTAIGAVSITIGIAELISEGSVAVIVDRLGKKRSTVLGLLLFAAVLVALPLLGRGLVTAVTGYALAIALFEFALVSIIPLVSELVPTARATLLALNVGAFSLGRLVAPLLGTALYDRTGQLATNSLLSAAVCVTVAGILWVGVRGDM